MWVWYEPAEASSMATAPSKTRRAFSTSTVKSTCPGVSIRLIRCRCQRKEMQADVIVMPARGKLVDSSTNVAAVSKNLELSLDPYNP